MITLLFTYQSFPCTVVNRLVIHSQEHESEGGRTPLMKACRAGHQCTVKFLIQKGADVNRQSTNNDHTPLSLASAGGHLAVVQLLLQHNADPFHKLKDNSTMLIEAAKGGHTKVVQLLLDYPHSIMMGGQQAQSQAGTTTPQPPTQLQAQSQPVTHSQPQSQTQPQPQPQPSTVIQTQTQPPIHPASPEQVQQAQLQQQRHVVQQAGLIAVPDAVQALPQEEVSPAAVLNVSSSSKTGSQTSSDPSVTQFVTDGSPEAPDNSKKSLLRKNRAAAAGECSVITSAEAQQAKNVPPGEGGAALSKEESNILDKGSTGEQLLRQQIYADIQRVEEEQGRKLDLAAFTAGLAAGAAAADRSNVLSLATSFSATPPEPQPSLSTRKGAGSSQGSTSGTSLPANQLQLQAETQSTTTPTTTSTTSNPAAIYLPPPPSTPPQTVTTSAEVNQSTAISDRPKAKPATKKETKLRKQQIVHAVTQELAFQAAQMAQMGQNSRICAATAAAAVNLAQINNQQQIEQRVQTLDQEVGFIVFHLLCFGNFWKPAIQFVLFYIQALQRHQQLHLHHQLPQGGSADPAAVDKVAAGSILTPNQLIAHLQQLDPSITAATPQQLHHHVHQVLHQKTNLRTLQQILPGGPDDLAELLSDQVDQGTLDRENLASAVVDSLEALQALALDDITVNGRHCF